MRILGSFLKLFDQQGPHVTETGFFNSCSYVMYDKQALSAESLPCATIKRSIYGIQFDRFSVFILTSGAFYILSC